MEEKQPAAARSQQAAEEKQPATARNQQTGGPRPVTETAWNARVGRTGDVGLPGQNWSRSLGGQNTTASAINTYLPDTVSLSNFQLERFWGIVSTVCRVGGLHAGTEAMVSKVVAA